ncbi:hypothetical protein ACTFIY_003945 [Dictyostelium cf. discoideum]
MKQLLLIISLIFICLNNISFCLNYPTGEIQDISGNCLSSPKNQSNAQQHINQIYSFLFVTLSAFIIKSVISQSCLQSSSKIAPVYDQNKIPLTVPSYLSESRNKYFLDSNEGYSQSGVYRVLWKNVEKSPLGCSPSAVLKKQKDGNLCTYVHENNPNANWCSMTQGLNGRYFNILPPGSYGKRWGLVIQSEQGKMVWGKWGESIYPDAGYNLIPGSFIDEKSNNRITGNYLTLDYNTGLSYYIGNPTINSRKLVWSSQTSIKNDSAVVTTQYFLEGQSNWIDVPIWTTRGPIKGGRFLNLPILNQNDTDN